MIDTAHIKVKAGNGGRGGVAFNPAPPHRREGGNGGKGGDIYICGNAHMNTLTKYHMKTHYEADAGVNGNTSKKNGRTGKDLILYFPYGTQVSFNYNNQNCIYDILDDQKILILNGGKGGIGNAYAGNKMDHYRTISPEIKNYTDIYLNLKVIGDIGLIGMPNAGKSSIINKITNSKSKIGDYAFTTLFPHLGAYNNLIIVDLPGIIEGASEGKGLGNKFLSHIERCKTVAMVLDITDNPIEKFKILCNEIKHINIKKVVLLNKIDKMKNKNMKLIGNYFKKLKIKFLFVSALYTNTSKIQKFLSTLEINN